MILFLYGPDTYRSRQKLQEIIERYKKIHKNGLNLVRLNLENNNFEDFKQEMATVSMFREKKLIILEDAFSNPIFVENFLKNKEKLFIEEDENIIIFFQEGEVNSKNPLFLFLKKTGKCQEFELLNGEKLKNWVRKEFESYQKEIAPDVLNTLIFFVGNDLWRLSQEIKKLSAYQREKRIGKKDIELLVKPEIETDIFKTIDEIAAKRKKIALQLIHQHLEKGDSPLYLLSMINFQFRNLLVIKDLLEKRKPYYELQKITNLHPFVIKKSYNLAQKFSFEELKKIYQKIFQVDLDIKTGRINSEIALDLLIAEI